MSQRQRQISQTMDDLLNSTSDSIQKRIMKLRIVSSERINGPVGMSKPIQYSNDELKISVNHVFDKLEKTLLDELRMIQEKRKVTIESITDSNNDD